MLTPNVYLLQVIWKTLFTTSSRDHGTLGHLCSLLGRLPKAKDPKKDFNACSDALFTILKGHFIAAACDILGIRKPDEEPASLVAVKRNCPDEDKKAYIYHISQEIVNKYSSFQRLFLTRRLRMNMITSITTLVSSVTLVLWLLNSLTLGVKGMGSASFAVGGSFYSTFLQQGAESMPLKHFV